MGGEDKLNYALHIMKSYFPKLQYHVRYNSYNLLTGTKPVWKTTEGFASVVFFSV